MSKPGKRIDLAQLSIIDLIEDISRRQAEAAPAPRAEGKASMDAAVRAIISSSLKRSPLSRYEVAARMSEGLGVEITKAQIDAWSAESKENHRFPIVYAPAFCRAVADSSLIRYAAEMTGGYYIEGEDAIHLAEGRIEHQMRELQKQRRLLRALKKEMKHK